MPPGDKTVRVLEIEDKGKQHKQRIKTATINLFVYTIVPSFIWFYLRYKKWATGNDDRLDNARKIFWKALGIFAALWCMWWMILFYFLEHNLLSIFIIPYVQNGNYFFNFIWWLSFSTSMNFFSASKFKIVDFTKVEIKKGKFIDYLHSDERIDWKEFPEPQANNFVLGTDGHNWIKYGWMPPLYERTGFAITGDRGRGRGNAADYLIACAFGKECLLFGLDGKPSSGVDFSHLRDCKHVLIADDYEMIIRTVKWLKKILTLRLDRLKVATKEVKFPRIIIACDEEVSATFLPGRFIEKEKVTIYNWPAVHKDLLDILHNGSVCDMHIIAMLEPSEVWLSIQERNRPYFEEIDFYYCVPREIESGGVAWIKPHDRPFLDMFSIRIGNNKIIGKMPYIPKQDLAWWINTKAEMAGDDTVDLWERTKKYLPDETIGERIKRDELIWVGGKLVRQSVVDSGNYQPEIIDRGAREEFYQKHHANDNGNGKAENEMSVK